MSSVGRGRNAGPEPPESTPALIWHFARAVLDERTMELRVDGKPVALEPKPLELLRELLRHAGEVVTKEELADAVWPGRIISESNLTKCISTVRDAVGDEQQAIVKTVHGYGYRLAALVRIEEAASAAAPGRFAFEPGSQPPRRPDWRLEQKLGSGGHGEVWLARHVSSGESRVFKFAGDGAGLNALKREITLFRLMLNAMPEREDYVRLKDWNLEESPFFVEREYFSAGNLLDWSAGKGGIDKVAPETRLDIAAQIAEAVASAHAIGVLHRDLKPANVMIVEESGLPRIKISDFGSGGVVDVGRIAAVGITRMGFTQTRAGSDATSGTPIYLAPEVFTGHIPTVQADIYALGVILYQLLAGDLQKPLAAGWENNVTDGLLRADIAEAAHGNVELRLADAAGLARRLRSLPARRAEHDERRQIQLRAEHARLTLERAQARRGWMLAAIAALTLGMAASLGLYLRAELAREEAVSVASFLTGDVLGAVDFQRVAIGKRTVDDMLEVASGLIDKNFTGNPHIAAKIHLAFGKAFSTDRIDRRREQFAGATALFEQALGAGARPTLEAKFYRGTAEKRSGDCVTALNTNREVTQGLKALSLTGDPLYFQSLAEQGVCQSYLGDWEGGAENLRLAMDGYARVSSNADLIALYRWSFAYAALTSGQIDQAERYFGEVAAHLERLGDGVPSWQPQFNVQFAELLTLRGRTAQAQVQLDKARRQVTKLSDDRQNQTRFLLDLQQAQLLRELRKTDEALSILHELSARRAAFIPTADPSLALVLTYLSAGRIPAARLEFQDARRRWAERGLKDHPAIVECAATLARALVEHGQAEEAEKILDEIPVAALKRLPAGHLFQAELSEARGLLLASRGHRDAAIAALHSARDAYIGIAGADSWRTRQVEQALSRLPPAPKPVL